MYSKTRVLIVDDSALMRKYLREIIEEDRELEVVGAARDGREAVELNISLEPDVITMDINMPRMDGLTAIQHIMARRPCPVLVVSSLTQKGALTTFEALELGAVDYVPKPDGTVSLSIKNAAREIRDKIKAVRRVRVGALKYKINTGSGPAGSAPPAKPVAASGESEKLVLIGVSTGGPKTLMEILPHLPDDFGAPVVVVQHMPGTFTRPFADRLNRECRIEVRESEEGMPLVPGRAVVARGGVHLRIDRRPGEKICRLRHSHRPADALYKPSVEVAFRSALECVDARGLVAVLLTGMGDDGADAMVDIRQGGGLTIAEAEETAVVWGMPGEAVKRGGASVVLPHYAIAGALIKAVH
ncbi:MAG: chemotaxis response regulator protein-glutamate methylesterase [Peptococcaceae bacterium]|nr:chemotaxis response regulator protein-glutamate methylesterase [Peptococcaceae bacterium]